MTDAVLAAFLARQREEGLALAAASDLLELVPVDGTPCQRYLADFRCSGLAQSESGEIVEAGRFVLGIWFPDSYLREADPFRVLTCLEPRSTFHPNVSGPFVCVGRLAPGTPLVDLLYRCFEIITYRKVTMREEDALQPSACGWARQNQHRFPLDRRSLRRQVVELGIEIIETPKGRHA
jgi:hypothetical protein